MKITMAVLLAVALALTFGPAYAESARSSPIMGEVLLNNGITYSDLGAVPDCWSVYGAGAGGLIPEAEVSLSNGITSFELAVPGSRPTGLCAGNIFAVRPSDRVNNGITVFE